MNVFKYILGGSGQTPSRFTLFRLKKENEQNESIRRNPEKRDAFVGFGSGGV